MLFYRFWKKKNSKKDYIFPNQIIFKEGIDNIFIQSAKKILIDQLELYSQDYIIKINDYLDKGKLSEISEYFMKNGKSYDLKFLNKISLENKKNEIKKNLNAKLRNKIKNKKTKIKIISSNAKKNYIEKNFEIYKKLHFISSGRLTRNEDSWILQNKMIIDGEGFIVNSFQNKDIISSIFISTSKDTSYYLSGCGKEMERGLWSAILYSKKKKLSFFIINDDQNIYTDGLGSNFSNFKSKFGGKIYPYVQIDI